MTKELNIFTFSQNIHSCYDTIFFPINLKSLCIVISLNYYRSSILYSQTRTTKKNMHTKLGD